MAALQLCMAKFCIQRSIGQLIMQICKLAPRFVRKVLLSLINEQCWLSYMETSEDGESHGGCLQVLC